MKPKDAKTLPAATALHLSELADYAPGAIVSRTVADNAGGSVTLFAFDAGQGLSEHSAPFDALLCVLDGQAELTIGKQDVRASAGQLVVMPAGVPHAVRPAQRFKMLLIMLKAK